MTGPVAVTVGTFDGVHLGHRRLLRYAGEMAAASGLELVVLTLDRHPLSLLRPEKAPRLLTGLEHKRQLLAATAGVARVEVLVFDEDRADQSPRSFLLDTLLGDLGATVLVVGENFRFGHGGAGDLELAAEVGASVGLSVVGMPLLEQGVDGVVSSSRIRRLVADGDLATAASLLGRPFELRGELALAPEVAGGKALGLVVAADLLLPEQGRHEVLARSLAGRAETRAVAFVPPAAPGQPARVGLELPSVGRDAGWAAPGAAVALSFPGGPRRPLGSRRPRQADLERPGVSGEPDGH